MGYLAFGCIVFFIVVLGCPKGLFEESVYWTGVSIEHFEKFSDFDPPPGPPHTGGQILKLT